jgi:hypothetical protein
MQSTIEVWKPAEHTIAEEIAHAQRLAEWLYKHHIEEHPYDHSEGINGSALECSLRNAALELERVRAAIAEVKLMPHHDECIMMAENCGCYKGRRLAELQRREKELSAKNS